MPGRMLASVCCSTGALQPSTALIRRDVLESFVSLNRSVMVKTLFSLLCSR